ncbi:MAG: hypothetical protein JST22_03175 [Bacteroidetes bacterium]|nr:hypothetical protein [Bacteroidota bacterium]
MELILDTPSRGIAEFTRRFPSGEKGLSKTQAQRVAERISDYSLASTWRSKLSVAGAFSLDEGYREDGAAGEVRRYGVIGFLHRTTWQGVHRNRSLSRSSLRDELHNDDNPGEREVNHEAAISHAPGALIIRDVNPSYPECQRSVKPLERGQINTFSWL